MAHSQSCPFCDEALAPPTVFCPSCGAPLRFERGRFELVHPAIRPGELLASIDLRVTPLPGFTRREETFADADCRSTPTGVEVRSHKANHAEAFWVPRLRVRHVCARLAFRALDAGIFVSVFVRDEPLESARTRYMLEVRPESGTVTLCRTWASEAASGVTEIVPAVHAPMLRGIGELNEIELRAQESALEGWVNGQRVLAAHDPSFGIGRVGMRMEASARSVGLRRAEFVGFEARGVAR